jgi:hypothetical protein
MIKVRFNNDKIDISSDILNTTKLNIKNLTYNYSLLSDFKSDLDVDIYYRVSVNNIDSNITEKQRYKLEYYSSSDALLYSTNDDYYIVKNINNEIFRKNINDYYYKDNYDLLTERTVVDIDVDEEDYLYSLHFSGTTSIVQVLELYYKNNTSKILSKNLDTNIFNNLEIQMSAGTSNLKGIWKDESNNNYNLNDLNDVKYYKIKLQQDSFNSKYVIFNIKTENFNNKYSKMRLKFRNVVGGYDYVNLFINKVSYDNDNMIQSVNKLDVYFLNYKNYAYNLVIKKYNTFLNLFDNYNLVNNLINSNLIINLTNNEELKILNKRNKIIKDRNSIYFFEFEVLNKII